MLKIKFRVQLIDFAHKMCYNMYNNSERSLIFMATTNVTIRMDKELKAQSDLF